jgi:hypothetical protein
MIEKVCWYIAKDEKVMAVSLAQPCAVDTAARGETVIKSNWYEDNLLLIKSVDEAGKVQLKHVVTGEIEKVADDLIRVHIKSETFTGSAKLNVLGMLVDKKVGEVLEIETLPNYPLVVSFEPSQEYVGVIKEVHRA